jgi:hypothetical protein
MRGSMLAGLVLLVAAVFPSVAPAAHRPRVARFNATLTVWQKTTWTQRLTIHACGGGVFVTTGHGESKLKVHTASVQRLTVRLVHSGGREMALTFGDGTASVPVIGTLKRVGSDSAQVINPGTPGACPPPEHVPVDCGTRRYPVNSRIGFATDYWPDMKRRHDADVIYPTGPYSPDWSAGPGFVHCLAMGRDDMLAGTVQGERPALQALLLQDVFGRKHHFEVHRERTQTIDHMQGVHTPGITGTRPVTIETRWRLRLTRAGHRRHR